MNVFWYEVNEAWSEASLVWLWSFVKACERSVRREEVKLVIWCVEGEWVTVYTDKASQIVRGVIECEVRPFNIVIPDDLKLNSRCIPESSVGIAISRVEHLNEMLGEDNVVVGISSTPVSYEGLYGAVRSNVYIHCDIDGIFTEWFNLDSYLEEIEVCNGGEYVVGVDEYNDIYPALSVSHTSDFMDRLGGVYVNCGLIAFCNFKPIDMSKLYEFLSSTDSYCLEQDYINANYRRYVISGNYNYTFRKKKVIDSTCGYMLPYFIHYYGEVKPFLLNSSFPDDKDIYEYWCEWFYMALRLKGVLSDEFLGICRENFIYAQSVN